MESFTFHRPQTIEEAVAALQGADEGKLLAGGQSLIPLMKLDMAQPTDLISLAGIDALRGVSEEDGAVVIGAGATHDDVARSELVTSKIPSLAALAGAIGDPQVRNRGTLGGSLAHADPAADYPGAVLALGATIRTSERPEGIPADVFFKGLFETELEEHEIITAVAFPVPRRAHYAKFASPASKYAIVGVFVADFGGGDVRVAVTGAGEHVFRVGEMEEALAEELSPAALEGVSVPADELRGDVEAGADYRAHLIGVMARRAVAALVG
ncbi:MAG: xanthine dehydrogenase family protein subunit M [Myxococcales bacterium]|nr:xanthine dehydrogenase family protein subunit M [Myxococcales bacterium]